MADYIKAFKQGLEAAEVADRARKEINAVFLELNRQLSDATDGKISIDRKQFEVPKVGWDALIPSFPFTSRETYLAIAAYNPADTQARKKELAKWEQDRTGYPCKIKYNKMEIICEDKEALEKALTELLQDPIVGEKLNVLMKVEVAQSNNESPRKPEETNQ